MKKLAKNEKICVDCGRIIRVRSNRQKRCKSCSKQRNLENTSKRNKKIRSVGTPATWNLSPRAVKKELFFIRNNIDRYKKVFSSDKSKRDVILDKMVYNEDCSIIREV